MIHSMTGYASKTRDLPGGSLSLELKSVNSRFLDIHFRVCDELRMAEPALREVDAVDLLVAGAGEDVFGSCVRAHQE